VRAVALAAALVASPAARAHGRLLTATGFPVADGLVLTLVVAALVAYGVGARRLAARRAQRLVGGADAIAFYAGIALLVLALLGPLDAWAERSFTVHMVQHEILMLAVAPLLVLGRPLAHWTWSLSTTARRRLRGLQAAWRRPGAWQAITSVGGACALQSAALWAWHVPAWFRAAVEHPGLHVAQHATFLAVALCFWWSVLQPGPARRRAPPAVASLFVTTLVTGALGALLTFSSTPWYAEPGVAPLFGLTPDEDQQLGGLLMWIPGGTVYMAVALWLGARALRGPAARAGGPLARPRTAGARP
jgi:putative membrane protein